MGKGARNRRKRAEAKAAAQAQPVEAAEAMDLLLALELENPEAFEELVANRPGILSPETEADFVAMAALEGFETPGTALATLVRDAREEPRGAWNQFWVTWKGIEKQGAELEPEIARIDAAATAGDHEQVIERVDRAIERARAAGLGVGVGLLHSQRATAYLYRRNGDRAENLDQAIADYDAAVRLVISDEQRAEVLMHAGIAYMERVNGDKAENIEQAIALLREALSELDSASPPELGAIVKTNLAVALTRRERGNRSEARAEAAELCQSALEYRSPDRNARDWAYSQINLGHALEDLATLGAAGLDDAVRAYDSVVAEADRINEKWLVGAAHHALGRLERARAHPTVEEHAAAAEEGIDLEVDRGLLESARGHLEAARPLVADAPDYLLRGRLANDLSAVLSDLGDESDETVALANEALSILRPTAAPFDCIDAGFRLGGMLADQAQWPESADAYRDAVQAAELTFHARLETESREADIRRIGTLFRWAAFSIAVAGGALEAALVLESGRTREIRRRLGLERSDADRIEDLPQELAVRYRQALTELSIAPIGSPAGRELQETLELIRSIPGFESFGGTAQRAELAAAVEPGWPLIYINPTPAGTLLLVVSADSDGPVVTPIFLDNANALMVYMRLMAGDLAADLSHPGSTEPSSLLALVAGVSERPPEQDLDQVLPWLGETIARPLRGIAADAAATGLTLVPCGPIAVAPIHAAPWQEGRGQRCLVDELDVRYAQSALIAATGISRAAERDTANPALAALADPTRDLPAAEPEVREIANHFPAERQRLATGADATAAFLRANATAASHLHLACHARGGVLDSDAPAAVLLSDGWLAASALTEMGLLPARLVAISACQSAVGNLGDMADESISIGSVMIVAGAACAIASLWPVHDLATALLMTRLYEELFDRNYRPPEALRRAQLWLRQLTLGDEQEFLNRHPALRVEFDKRAESHGLPGDRPRGERSTTRPYTHEYYWAGFVAVGA
jgi:tetratricopeptide (TPR) repeat protein